MAVSNALSRQPSNTIAIIESNFVRVATSTPVPTGTADPGGAVTAKPAPAGEPAPLQFTNAAPGIVMENMRRAIRQYGDRFGGDPVGTNPEITGQLNGGNPRHVNFINAEAGMRIVDGQLVDPWGTPYFFHQISASEMEIHSAGPDRVMWTDDDLVAK